MASRETIQLLLKQVFLSYPKEANQFTPRQIANMVDVWGDFLSDIDDALLVAAVREHITRSQWLPSVAELRASAVRLLRQASPASQLAVDAWSEVTFAMRRYGMDVTRPSFPNPITEKVIQRLGWFDICTSDAPDGVLRAQFERYYDAEMRRAEQQAQQSPAVTAFVASIGAAAFTSLPEPKTAGIVADIARRLAVGSPEDDMTTTVEDLGY